MAKIPINMHTTKNLIEHQPDTLHMPERTYLSMSNIGAECIRSLWYDFHWTSMKRLSVRAKRIFARGDIEEKRIITDLKKVGIEVYRKAKNGDRIPMTGEIGEEQEELIGSFGHAAGHPDGRCLGVIEAPSTEHTLEMKTMAEKYFNAFEKNGIKTSHPKYFAQVQRYMRAMFTKRTLFIATNKNNEAREYERIEYDKDFADALVKKEEEIILAPEPFGEKFSRAHFICKYCNHYPVCHDDEPPLRTCRSCKHHDLGMDGKWVCDFWDGKLLSKEAQLKGCEEYRRAY